MAAPFTVRLKDGAQITAQAGETAYGWAGDRVEIIRDDRSAAVQQQGAADGLFTLPAGGSRQATVTNATRAGSVRSGVIWRKVSGGGAVIAPGIEQPVEVSTRLRMSTWAFTPPLAKSLKGSDILLDPALLGLFKQANIDDLSLVHTIAWDQRAKAKGPAKPPKWHKGFVPLGSTPHRLAYLRKLIAELHKLDVQVIPGYELVKASKDKDDLTKEDKAFNAYAQDFADWLLAASPDQIADYAHAIYAFFADQDLDIDGIGFDFEFDELTAAHQANLGLLYQKVSDAMAHRNGLVSYANAPFQQDGVNSYGFMQAQPYALAARGLNLLARPMCFDGSISTSLTDLTGTIACALAKAGDPKHPGGAGLHPSQVQLGIWTDQVSGGVESLCRTLLRPNRIGLMLYSLPPQGASAEKFLKDCVKWDQALNPSEGPPGQGGQPFQVPRGFGGWPPPFKSTS